MASSSSEAVAVLAVPMGEKLSFRQLILDHTDISHRRVSEDSALTALVEEAQAPFNVLLMDGIIESFHLRDCMLPSIEVHSGSPAQVAGVQVGDFLLAVDGVTPGSAHRPIDERGAECVFLRAADLDEAIVIKLRHSGLKTGSTEQQGEAMTLLWYANSLNGRGNFWGFDDDRFCLEFLRLGLPLQALEAARSITRLPARQADVQNPFFGQPMPSQDDPCECCVEAPRPQPQLLIDFRGAEISAGLVLHAAALADVGDYDYAAELLAEFDAIADGYTGDWGQLADAVATQVSAGRSGRMNAQDVQWAVDAAGDVCSDQAVRILEGLVSIYGRQQLPAFKRAREKPDPRVGGLVPDWEGTSLYKNPWCGVQSNGKVSVADQLQRLGPDQLLLVIYMGWYRTNGPYDDTVQAFAAEVGLLVPQFVVGALVITYSKNTPENDSFTRNWVVSERRAIADGVPWAVLQGDQRSVERWEAEFFSSVHGQDEFGGAPSRLLVDCNGKVRGTSTANMFAAAAAVSEMPPTARLAQEPGAATSRRSGMKKKEEKAPKPAEMLRGASLKF